MKYAAFTMDLEALSDTECIAQRGLPVEDELFDGVGRYLTILERFDARATLFLLCSTPASLDPLLHAAFARGHRPALHGLTHTPPLSMGTSEFFAQVAQAKRALEARFGLPIIGYRAPFFSLDRERLDVLRALGFRYDSSLGYAGARHVAALDLSGFAPRGGGVWTGGGFCELAPSQVRLFGKRFPVSGGGYMRLCPWPVLKPALQRYLRENDCYIFYLHPFELSEGAVGPLRGLRLYDRVYLHRGRSRFSGRLEQLLSRLHSEGYTLMTLEEMCSRLAEPVSLQEEHKPDVAI